MKALNQMLIEAEFLSPESDVTGSRIYLPAGWKVRNSIFRRASELLDSVGFQEFHMPSVLRKSHIEKLDALTKISSKYFAITEDLRLAATHEAAFFPFAHDYISKRGHRPPVNLYHLGPAYRKPKTSPVPFNLGERYSYLEVFSVCHPDDYDRMTSVLFRWAITLPMTLMNLPSMRVRRPGFGNLGFSEQTLTVETILPIGKTLCTAMVYKQASMFTRLFSFADEEFALLRSVHAGVTDNLFFAYLANCLDPFGFSLHSEFAVTQVLVSFPDNDAGSHALAESLKQMLEAAGIRVGLVIRKSRDASRDLGLFRKQGIPVFVSIEPALVRDGMGRAYSRSNPFQAIETDLSTAASIQAMLVVHDSLVKRRLDNSRRDSVIHVRNVDECREAVNSGKVASFYLEDDAAAVAELDAKLPGAEILGHDTELPDCGESVLNNSSTGQVCYASRRL